MRILYYDCFAGISGDMNLAAMLELGIEKSFLESELAKLHLPDHYKIEAQRDSRCGIFGTRVDVHTHSHSHSDTSTHSHSHDHRGFTEIAAFIDESDLSDPVKQTSLAIFRRIGEAEAHVHGCTIDEIHFHEVGAVDSIVDIVGASICYHALAPDRVLCSTIELGGGFVTCAHGKIPIPAPATVEILKGIPTRRGTVRVETTTPTGAAILAELVDSFTDTPELLIEQTAYGIGHREMDIPNALRVQLASPVVAANPIQDDNDLPATTPAFLLECAIDDMSPELLGVLMDRLFAAGASDVNYIPVGMKKNRPGTLVSVLASPEREPTLRRLLLEETTTLGLKRINVDKTELPRQTRTIDTPHGTIRIKDALLGDRIIKSKPELDDCLRAAEAAGVTVATIQNQLLKGDYA
jgi:uncharacterized protein (TIGR00299 family) protein